MEARVHKNQAYAILRYAPKYIEMKEGNLNICWSTFIFSLHLFIQWLASRFMEHLRMNLARYKFKSYFYFPLRDISKCYQFCEHSPFLNFNYQFAALNTSGKQNLHWFPRILCHSRCTRRFLMNCIMIFASKTKWCLAESKEGNNVI